MTNGIYVVVVRIEEDVRIGVGALGNIDFAKGTYAYVGSAQKGLEKRIMRHFRKSKRKFWHIDYLLDDDHVKILRTFCKEAGKAEECRTAEKFCQKNFPVNDFGSSDCECISHLFKLRSHQILEELIREIHMKPDHRPKRTMAHKKFAQRLSLGTTSLVHNP